MVNGFLELITNPSPDKALSFDDLQLSLLLFLGIIRALVIFGIPQLFQLMLDMAFCFLLNFSGIDSCNFFPNFQFFREVGLSSEHSSLANYGCEVVPGRGGSLGD